jgi:nicotinamidase/pyrazinamidase|tara:strand:+ start:3380 stop:4204 length:825 start_codon:yes stop_codon:yes gene_type:complete
MFKRNKNALVLIDCQKSFCDPDGALFVQGAVEDSQRTSDFILRNSNEIDLVAMTFDSHDVLDISHPAWWRKANGDSIDPYTTVTLADIDNGVYFANKDPKRSRDYVQSLEANGEFPHFIWPEHCVVGRTGWAIQDDIRQAVESWELEHKTWKQKVTKGSNPYTEHFGAFRANVPMEDDQSTQANTRFLSLLSEFENVYLCGQARDYCVVNTLKQALEIAPQLASNIIVLDDCMSSVNASPEVMGRAQKIYDDAKSAGVRFTTSIEAEINSSVTA